MYLLRNLGIRRKLTVINAVTSGVALLLACAVIMAYELVVIRESMVSDLFTTATIVGDNSAAALTFNDAASAERTLRSLETHPQIVEAALYTRDGVVFASYRRSGMVGPFQPPALRNDGHRFAQNSLQLFQKFAVAGELVGAVYIHSDLTELRSRMQRYAMIVIVVLISACAIAALLSARLQASIAGPISHLADVVKVVSDAKNYAVRASKQSDDELGRLIDGFNGMLQQIEVQDAALQEARIHLEKRVQERTRELQREIIDREQAQAELRATHQQLMEASRQAGRAEVAISVLHNVGNVLNSVNVSVNMLSDGLRTSKVVGLQRLSVLLEDHASDLAAFMIEDPRGKHLPEYLKQLTTHLLAERTAHAGELESLRSSIDHIKQIVTMQQAHSKVCGVKEAINVVDLLEDTLRMSDGSSERHAITIRREITAVPEIVSERHKILQILVNLVRNAQLACSDSPRADKLLILRIGKVAERIQVAVIDNGVGIAAENLERIFSYGFTTRKDGHGFGLHSSALTARELGGSLHAYSDGIGCGATFILELPVQEAVSHA